MVLPYIPDDCEPIDDIEALMAGEKDPLIIIHPGAQSVPVSLTYVNYDSRIDNETDSRSSLPQLPCCWQRSMGHPWEAMP
jgi:hypothetical protein